MILSFISIDMSYLRITYSLSDNLKICISLGSKSVYLCLWRLFMFLVSFLNACLPESKFLPRELAPAFATSETGPVSVRALRRPQLMSVIPWSSGGQDGSRLCSGEPRASHSLAAPSSRLLSAHSACRSRSGGSGPWAGVLERPFTSHKSSSEGTAALCLKRDVFFSPDFLGIQHRAWPCV